MLMEYLASTLYHALAIDGAKRVFKVIDHAAIYLFIAGSYTPMLGYAFRIGRRVSVTRSCGRSRLSAMAAEAVLDIPSSLGRRS